LIGDGALREAANRVCSLAGLAYQQADAMLEARKAGMKAPNAKVSGAGTASAGLPGWQANGKTE